MSSHIDNSKCDCGATKVYGKDTTLHAQYCSALKRDPDPEPNEDGPKWPWSSDSWVMQNNNNVNLVDDNEKRRKLLLQFLTEQSLKGWLSTEAVRNILSADIEGSKL